MAKFSDLQNIDDIDGLINCLNISNDPSIVYFIKADISTYDFGDVDYPYPYLINNPDIADLPNGTLIDTVNPIGMWDIKVDNIGNLALCYSRMSGFDGKILGFKDD